MAREKKWGPWVYNPRPRGWGSANTDPTKDRVRKLRKLIAASEQNGDRVYRLPGTTFRFTINTPVTERDKKFQAKLFAEVKDA